MNTSTKGRELHALAEQSRENQDLEKALVFTDQATVAYQSNKDYLGMAEVQSSRFLVFRQLFDKTEDKTYLMLAKFAALGSVQIAKDAKIPEALALPLYNLAKSYDSLGELTEAIRTYKEAIEQMQQTPPERHNRPAVLADMRVHLGLCEFKFGDKTALERVLLSLNELENSDEYPYNRDVWLSGGYMELAKLLKDEDPVQARQNLDKAKVIIDTNPELKARLTQWEKLAAEF